MAKLMVTSDEIAQLLVGAGAQGWTVVTMGAIAVPESGRNAYAVNVNHSPDKPSHRSIDVGLFQINTFYNPKQAIKDLLDPEYNVRAALQILASAGGPPNGYARWNTYKAGSHAPHLTEARAAARRIGVPGV
jgi:hypothetical protein